MTDKTQLDAILHGAAFAPITDRAFLRITGADATRWLNGMVTNNIKDLAPGQGNYNFLLNNQGRIMGDCTIYREPGAELVFLLETSTDQIDTIHQLLDKFIIMDDVELTAGIQIKGSQFTPSPQGIAITGPFAPESLIRIVEGGRIGEAYVAPQPRTMTFGRVDWNTVIILTQIVAGITTFEIWCDSRGAFGGLYRNLERSSTTIVSPETLEAYRIYSGTPRYGIDIRNTETAKDLPQETAQNHALHFSKGCYLGQEIVERIHSRGQVHRTFAKFELSGSLPAVPAILESNGKSVGELTSATNINDTIFALGYARREALDANQPLTYPGGTATLRK